jgi:hypothetical protein
VIPATQEAEVGGQGSEVSLNKENKAALCM